MPSPPPLPPSLPPLPPTLDQPPTLAQIEQLDPRHDYCTIIQWCAGYEFPWDMTRSLELALLKTFCLPSISALLAQTGEFEHHSQKRYDDTGLLVSEILKQGPHTPAGQAAIARMNRIHQHFQISNRDFLYVLSSFIYEPIRWNARFGWRKMTQTECWALFYFWQAVGTQMGITAIPDHYETFEQLNQALEQEQFRYAETNRRIAQATLDLFLSWFPTVLRSSIAPYARALLSPAELQVLGLPPVKPSQRRVVAGILRSRAALLRYFPRRRHSAFFVDQPSRSYGHSLKWHQVGPQRLLDQINSPP